MYSSDDHSLNFYKDRVAPEVGSTYDGKVVTAIYTGVETDQYESASAVPWHEHATDITNVSVVDEKIKPVSTAYWFSGCSNLATVDVGKLDVSKVENMARMFEGCASLTSISDIAQWNTTNVTNMSYMFCNCINLTLDCSSWNIEKVGENHAKFNGNAPKVKSPWAEEVASALNSGEVQDGTVTTLNDSNESVTSSTDNNQATGADEGSNNDASTDGSGQQANNSALPASSESTEGSTREIKIAA